MNVLEKELRDIIFEAPNKELRARGLDIYGFKRKEITIGNYGRCDLATIQKPRFYEECNDHVESQTITIYELKQNEINWEAFHQIVRYYKGIDSWLSRFRENGYELKMVLIGKSICQKSDFIYMPDILGNLSVYTYEYRFDGLYFKKISGYKLIEEGF